MNKNIKVLAFLFACLFIMPFVGLFVSNYSENIYEAQFYEATTSLADGISEAEYKSRNLSYMTFCKENLTVNAEADIVELCSYYNEVVYIKNASIAAIVIGFFLLFIIFVSKKYAGLNRLRLSRVFEPVVRLVMILLAVTVLIQGAIFVYSIYTLEANWFGRVHFGIIAAIGIGTLIACGTLLKYSFVLMKNKPMYVRAIKLENNSNHELHELVSDVAKKLGASEPNNIIVGLEPTFYVTASDIVITNTSEILTGRTLFLSQSLMRLFTKCELMAVIGHELGHFKGEDVAYSMKFAPTYMRLGSALNELESGGEGVSEFAKLPALITLGYCLSEFSIAERTIGRDRELIADSAGVAVSSSDCLATALIKVTLFSGLWQNLTKTHIDMLAEGNTYINLSIAYADYCTQFLDSIDWNETVEVISGMEQTHPVDTHPTLSHRIQSLGKRISDYTKLEITASNPNASECINNANEYEEHLSSIEAQWLEAIGVVIVPRNSN